MRPAANRLISSVLRTLLFCSILLPGRAGEAPPILWAEFIGGFRDGFYSPKLLADPAGGFYLFAAGDRPLIKFGQDNSIAWETHRDPGVSDVFEVSLLDVLDGGDLLAVVSAAVELRPAHIFGEAVTEGGSFLVRLRSSDGAPLFVRPIKNCTVTALKTRPGGGYFLSGFGSGAALIGTEPIDMGSGSIFLSQFADGANWTIRSAGTGPPTGHPIESIQVVEDGLSHRIFVAGNSGATPWTFGGATISEAGVFLLSTPDSGEVAEGGVVAPGGLFLGLQKNSGPIGSENLHLAWRNPQTGEAFLRGTGWEERVEGDVRGIGGVKGVYAVGSEPGGHFFLHSLSDQGATRWRLSQPSRSFSSGQCVAELSDGRIVFGGHLNPAGIFLDDFFLREFALIDVNPSAAFVAILNPEHDAAPAFRRRPQSQPWMVEGDSLDLAASVESGLALELSWRKDGALLPGRIGQTLPITGAVAADAGSYRLTAGNASGVAESPPVAVTINTVSVHTLAGNGDEGNANHSDPLAASFHSPRHPVALPDGSLLVADVGNHAVRRVGSGGVATFAGGGTPGLKGGAPGNARFNFPFSLALQLRPTFEPKLFVADRGNGLARQIFLVPDSFDADVVTGDNAVHFHSPLLVATHEGLPYVVVGESDPPRILKFSAGVSTVLEIDADAGPITALAMDARANVYFAQNHAILRLNIGGGITSIAGTHEAGFQDGLGEAARFNHPSGLAVDESGTIFITDLGNHSVRKISPGGFVTTVAGDGQAGYADGGRSEALFNSPEGICVRGRSLIVADTGNHRLREIRFEPVSIAQPVDTRLGIMMDSHLNISVNGPTGTRFELEWTESLPGTPGWESAGTFTIADPVVPVRLKKPPSTRFYRVRNLN